MAKRKQRSKYFQGELMTCVACGAQQRSDPAIESQWTAIVADGVTYYACPAEFPPEGTGTKDDYTMAYTRLLAIVMIKRSQAAGQDVG